MKQLVRNVKIIGTGSFLPEIIYSNEYLESILPTSAQWIFENLGIKERRIATENQATSDLAWRAGAQAIESAGLTKDDIDLIIARDTFEYSYPTKPIIRIADFTKNFLQSSYFKQKIKELKESESDESDE